MQDEKHAIESYIAYQRSTGVVNSEAWAYTLQTRLSRFLEEADKPIANLRKPDIMQWVQVQLTSPTHLKKPRSPHTVKKQLQAVRGFLEYCADMGLREKEDLWTGIKINTKRHNMVNRAIDKRHPIPLERVLQIANIHPMLEIMAYTGARNTEVYQLRTKDIRKWGGVWCLDLKTMDIGQSRKTTSSLRMMPVHPVLMKSFLDQGIPERHPDAPLIEWDKKPKSLFRALNYRIKSRLRVKELSMYGLRHSFREALRGQPKDHIRALMGHTPQDENGDTLLIDTTYGGGEAMAMQGGVAIQDLLATIKTIKYPAPLRGHQWGNLNSSAQAHPQAVKAVEAFEEPSVDITSLR